MGLFVPINSGPNVAIAECMRCHHHRQYTDLRQDPNNMNWYCKFGCIDKFDPWRLPPRRTEDISLRHARPDPQNYSTNVPPILQLALGDASADLVLSGLTATKTTSVGASNFRANDQITSGKWYWEVNVNARNGSAALSGIGISTPPVSTLAQVGVNATGWAYIATGQILNNGVGTAFGAAWNTGDVVGITLDVGKRLLSFYLNNAIQGAISLPALPTGVCPANSLGGILSQQTMNFGSVQLKYPPPQGFSPVFNIAFAYPYPANTQVEEGALS